MRQTVTASYPDPVLVNPNGVTIGAKANATVILATPTGEDVKVQNGAVAQTRLAPAIAVAGTSLLTSGATTGLTTAAAVGRPGLQYGVVFAQADQQMQNLGEPCVCAFVFCFVLTAICVHYGTACLAFRLAYSPTRPTSSLVAQLLKTLGFSPVRFHQTAKPVISLPANNNR